MSDSADKQGPPTSTFQTFVSLVQALAWPIIVIVIFLLFEGPVARLVDRTSSGTVKVPGGAELTFAAIVASGKQEISGQVTQVTPLPVTRIQEATKGGVSEIHQRIEEKTQALDFTLGYGGYNEDAIRAYFNALIPYSFFKYVIFLNSDKTFFGMLEARALVALLQDPAAYGSFTAALNRGSEADRAYLAHLPGFVPKLESVSNQAQKREVLESMEKTGREWLPVVAADGKFLGVVDRSRLTASMVLDVTNRLTSSPPQDDTKRKPEL
jgi:hypothetical protein